MSIWGGNSKCYMELVVPEQNSTRVHFFHFNKSETWGLLTTLPWESWDPVMPDFFKSDPNFQECFNKHYIIIFIILVFTSAVLCLFIDSDDTFLLQINQPWDGATTVKTPNPKIVKETKKNRYLVKTFEMSPKENDITFSRNLVKFLALLSKGEIFEHGAT